MTKKSAKMPLYEQVIAEIKGQIMSGVYKKGDLLPSEKEYIDSQGVSRITVRKALSILADMGLIETSKGRGSVVLFSIEEMKNHNQYAQELEDYKRSFMETNEVRLMLEPEIASQVARRATDEQIEYLRNILKKPLDPLTMDFHIALVEILDNKELTSILKQMIELEDTKAPKGIIPPEKQEKTGKIVEEQHKRILEAIEDRDSEFAYFYMKDHTKFMASLYEEYFGRL